MTQSAEPKAAPNTKRTTASNCADDTVTSTGNAAQATRDEAVSTTRHPYRVLRAPAGGVASIDPIPKQSSTSPRAPSFNWVLAFAKGTRQAHAAATNPMTRNATLVACRLICSTVTCSKVALNPPYSLPGLPASCAPCSGCAFGRYNGK